MIELILILIIIVLVYYIAKQSFYEKIYLNNNDGISIISKGTIVDCNGKLLELFGYEKKEQFLSLHPLELTPAFQPDHTFSADKAAQMMQIANEKGSCNFDWVFLTSNGDEKYTQIDIFKIKDTLLYKDKYCMVWKDISKRRAVEEQLKEFNENLELIIEKEMEKNKEQERMLFLQSKQAQMGEMISMIAHQWRQPLAAISSIVIDIKMKLFFQNKKDDFIEYMDKELNDLELYTQTLTNTIDDFRNFYKPITKPQFINISQTVRKAYYMVQNGFDERSIDVEFDLRSKNKIMLYENEVLQVLLDMFNNAKDNFEIREIIKPKIVIRTEDHDQFVVISFSDNGGGIDEDIIDQVFEPYFSTKHHKNGTGLGLYMSQKIIREHHNGDIKLKNIKDGVSFEIYLAKKLG